MSGVIIARSWSFVNRLFALPGLLEAKVGLPVKERASRLLGVCYPGSLCYNLIALTPLGAGQQADDVVAKGQDNYGAR